MRKFAAWMERKVLPSVVPADLQIGCGADSGVHIHNQTVSHGSEIPSHIWKTRAWRRRVLLLGVILIYFLFPIKLRRRVGAENALRERDAL